MIAKFVRMFLQRLSKGYVSVKESEASHIQLIDWKLFIDLSADIDAM